MKNSKFVLFLQKHRLFINIFLLFALFLGNCFCKEVCYGAFSLLAINVLFDNLQNGLSYICFCIPFSFISQIPSNLFMMACVVAYLIKVFLIYFIKDRGKIKLLPTVFCLAVLIYAAMPFGKYNYNFLAHYAMIAILLLALAAVALKPDIAKMHRNIRITALAVLFSFAFGLLNVVSPYLQSVDGKIVFEITYRFQALMHNPNMFAMLCEMTLAILAYFMVARNCRWQDCVLFGLVAVAGIFTQSKTYLIIVAILLLVLIIWGFFKNWKCSVFILSLLVVVGASCYFAFPDFIANYFHRFTGSGEFQSFADFMNKFKTGRYNLWLEMSAFLSHNLIVLFFGRGLGAPRLTTSSPHNAYLTMTYELGIVGALFLITAIALLLRQIFKKVKVSKAVIIPIATALLIFLVEDVIFYINF